MENWEDQDLIDETDGEEIPPKKEPEEDAFSSLQEDRTAFYQRRKKARAAARKRRTRIYVLLLALIVGLGFFIVHQWRGVEEKKIIPDRTGQPAVSADETTDPSASSEQLSASGTPASSEPGPSSESPSSAPETSESQAPESPQEQVSGTAMPKANTGEVVQNAGGKGLNHNAAANQYAYSVPDIQAAMFHGKPLAGGQKIAFLTFDDGPSSKSSPLLLDLLKKEGVPATFFMVGKYVTEATKPVIERTLAEGHAIAMHSFHHDYHALYPGRVGNVTQIVAEAKQVQAQFAQVLGREIPLHVWRYPGGHMSWKKLEGADQALAAIGVHWIDWNAENGDAKGKKREPKTVQGQIDFMMKNWAAYGKPNVITVLMHDTPVKALTRQALPEIIKTLRAQGFSFGVME